MKRLLIVAFLVLAASVGYRYYGSPETGTGSLTLPQPSPNRGDAAPLFTVEGANGDELELSGEGIYVLTFWSIFNEDTDDARPMFEKLAREYEEVSFAAVYVSSAPKEEVDTPYAVMQDASGRLAGLYNVKRVPRLFLIKDGTIEFVQNGYYPENEEHLEKELDRLLPVEN